MSMPYAPLCAGGLRPTLWLLRGEAALPTPLTPTGASRSPAPAAPAALAPGTSSGPVRTSESSPRRARTRRHWWQRPAYAVGLPLSLGLIHVALVAPHYFVGSFDDDAGYILTALGSPGRPRAHRLGAKRHLGSRLVSAWLLRPAGPAPLVVAAQLRAPPLAFDRLLRRSLPAHLAVPGPPAVSDGVRVATLILLALGPPLATFGSMVMAETPFLVLLVTLLLLVDRWDRQARAERGPGWRSCSPRPDWCG